MEVTEYTDCAAFNFGNRHLADLIEEHTRKGSLIYVEGQLQTKKYDQDGITRKYTQVLVNDVQFLERSPATEPQQTSITDLAEAPF